ncbi:MAG: transglycosylase SLT domain-containing protein [Anaerolineae bacterium]
MKTCGKTLAIALAAAIMIVSFAHPVLAQGDSGPDTSGLSPYWRPVVSRWETIIVRYAERRQIDPDLVASVIWKESRGLPATRGPTGAVGLMCIKPFPWRPSAAELENPWTNVAWGTQTLAQIIRDGNGDVYYALAAYNGGWDKIHRRATRRYAADVLGNYVRAVAVEHGLPADGNWTAILSVEGLSDHRTVTVLGPHRPVARYTERPVEAAIPSVPEGFSPNATPIRFTGNRGQEARVSLWLITEDRSVSRSSAALPASQVTPADGTSSNVLLDGRVGGLPD